MSFEKKLEYLKTVVQAYEIVNTRVQLSVEQLADLAFVKQLAWLLEKDEKMVEKPEIKKED